MNAITITVDADTGGAATQIWNTTADDMEWFQAWVESAYGGDDITPDQAVAAWAIATLQGTIDNVIRHHQLQAANDAISGLPPVTPLAPP